MTYVYAVLGHKMGLIGVFSSSKRAQQFIEAQVKRVREKLAVVRLGLNEKLGKERLG